MQGSLTKKTERVVFQLSTYWGSLIPIFTSLKDVASNDVSTWNIARYVK